MSILRPVYGHIFLHRQVSFKTAPLARSSWPSCTSSCYRFRKRQTERLVISIVCIYIYIILSIYIYTYIYIYVYMSIRQNFLFMARPWMIWGGSHRFTRISFHVSVRYRFALVKVRRPSDSLILLVACPALYRPSLPFLALYCRLLPFTCPSLPFTALSCPFTALFCPLLPIACPVLPFFHQNGQWVTKRTSRYR